MRLKKYPIQVMMMSLPENFQELQVTQNIKIFYNNLNDIYFRRRERIYKQ
jgi:hypothetical protein